MPHIIQILYNYSNEIRTGMKWQAFVNADETLGAVKHCDPLHKYQLLKDSAQWS
jgi:hypothetical protein